MSPRSAPTIRLIPTSTSFDGTWIRIRDKLHETVHVEAGGEAEPDAAIMDGQSVKTSEQGGPNRYDAAKDIRGRQRHLLVDTTGLILLVIVHLADVQDRDGARRILGALVGYLSRLQLMWDRQQRLRAPNPHVPLLVIQLVLKFSDVTAQVVNHRIRICILGSRHI